MHGGHFHDPNATRIEAYRQGMEAVLRGAGDGFILGCNHPIWPSFGLIHGSRSSNDIGRSWETFRDTARENLSRNWQNGRLWWNDPDCVLLTGNLTEDEYRFHATALLATGGMILSGDDLTTIRPERLAMLRKMLLPTGQAATFEDPHFIVGCADTSDGRLLYAFNWSDTSQTLAILLPGEGHLQDFWTDQDLGNHADRLELAEMPPHSARLFLWTT